MPYLSWTINNVLNPISIVLGVLTTIPIVWIWYDQIVGRRRRHKVWAEKAIDTPGHLPAVLVADCLGGRDADTAIRRFLASQAHLKDIPNERILTVKRNRDVEAEDMPALARDIQDAVGALMRHGPDELCVFLAGPGCVAAMVGAELSNLGSKVSLYHFHRERKEYVNYGLLRHPRF